MQPKMRCSHLLRSHHIIYHHFISVELFHICNKCKGIFSVFTLPMNPRYSELDDAASCNNRSDYSVPFSSTN